MSLIGYLLFREVDSVHYPIYRNNDGNIYVDLHGTKYRIQLPKIKTPFWHMELSHENNYENHKKELKTSKYGTYAWIDNVYIENFPFLSHEFRNYIVQSK